MARALGATEVAATREALDWSADAFVVPERPSLRPGARREAGAARQADWQRRFEAYARAHPAAGRRVRAARRAARAAGRTGARRCAQALERDGRERRDRHAQGLAERHRGCWPRMPELLGGSADLTGSNLTAAASARCRPRPALAATTSITAFASSAWRAHERHRAARRLHSLRRDVPGVLRLRAQCRAHGGADAPAGGLRVHARFDRPRRGRSDASAGRARGEPAPDPAQRRVAAVRCGGDHGRGSRRSSAPMDRAACCCRGRTCPTASAVAQQLAESVAAATSWPRRRGRRSTLLATGSEVALALAAREVRGEGSRHAWCRCQCCRRSTVRDRAVSRAGVAARGRCSPSRPASAVLAAYIGLRRATFGIDRFGESAPAAHVATELGFTREALCAAGARASVRGVRA